MTLKLDGPLLLAGAGNMGYALLMGWLERGLDPARIIVQDPAPSPRVKEQLDWHRIQVRAEVRSLPEVPAVLLVAVKPQVMDEVFPPLAQLVRSKTVVLSVAAGRRIDGFEVHLPKATAVVRAMPNTPASIGRGITVACANARAAPAQRSLCGELLGAVGEVHWVESEDQLAAVTALSGGGPAYVYLLTEVLAEAGIGQGLPEALARRLARVTVEGAGELSRLSPDEPATLRKNVTSPGGTTVEALKVLTGPGGLQPLFDRAIAAATARARELAD